MRNQQSRPKGSGESDRGLRQIFISSLLFAFCLFFVDHDSRAGFHVSIAGNMTSAFLFIGLVAALVYFVMISAVDVLTRIFCHIARHGGRALGRLVGCIRNELRT